MSQDSNLAVSIDTALPEYTLTIAGKEYGLRYDFGAFRAYQKLTGTDPFTPGFEINTENVDSFLWAGLRRLHPEVTIDTVQTWLTPMTVRSLLEFVGEAYYASFPPAAKPADGAGDDAGDPPKA